MKRIKQIVRCILVLSISSVSAARAQVGPPPMPDTSLWRPVFEHVFGQMSTYIARAARDSSEQVWSMKFPADSSPWRELERHLRTVLRARTPTPADSTFFVLSIGLPQISGDTARIPFETGMVVLCRSGLRGGYGNMEEMVSIHTAVANFKAWSAIRPGPVLHGDRASCGR